MLYIKLSDNLKNWGHCEKNIGALLPAAPTKWPWQKESMWGKARDELLPLLLIEQDAWNQLGKHT